MNLKELLVELHQGGVVTLTRQENQLGVLVDVDSICLEDGRWMRHQLNCWSSAEYGFGTCRCISHTPFRSERVSRKEVLSHLRQLLRNEAEDRAARDAEIAWLDEQIAV